MSLLLLLNSSAAPQFAFVQKAWNSTAGATPANTTLTFPSVGAGHLVLVSVEYLGTSTGFTLTVTDGNGHSFTLTPNSPFQYSTLARYIWIGYILSAAAGTMTITATPSVAHGISIHAAEFSYSGVASFDKDAGAFSTTGTTPANTPSINPTSPNALLYAAAIADPAGSGTLTAVGGGWTDGTRGTIAADSNNSGDAYILGASGTVPVSWTIGSSSATGWNAAAMAFNISPSGAMAGTASGSSTTSAIIAGTGAVSGTASGIGSQTAALTGKGSLTASGSGVATSTAVISAVGLLTATSLGTAATSASITATGALSGAASGTATETASITATGSLVGSSVGAASSTAQVSGSGALVGTATGTSTATGTLSSPGAGSMVASATGSATTSAILTATGQLVGSSSGTSTASAAFGSPSMSGTAIGSGFGAGILTATGALIGLSSGTSSATASIQSGQSITPTVASASAQLALKEAVRKLWNLEKW